MDIIEVHMEWHDTMMEDAFAYQFRKLLERLKREELKLAA